MHNTKLRKITVIITSLFLVLQTLLSFMFVQPVNAAEAESEEFKDIQNHWAKDAINLLVTLKVVNGYQDGTFKPEGTVSREQFVKMLMTAMGHFKPLENQSFADVPPGHWSYPYIEAAVQSGVIVAEEYGETFDPGNHISRTEMAVMAARSLGLEENLQSLAFKDANQMNALYRGLVGAAVKAGIITGFNDGTFRGSDTATRAQAAVIITRVLDHFPLHLAVRLNDYETVQSLLEDGYDINTRNENGMTPLAYAVLIQNTSMAKMLLDNGADANILDIQGDTPLNLASKNGSITIVEYLLNAGADPNLRNNGGLSSLIFAVAYKHHEIAERLINAGASPNDQFGTIGLTPLMGAAENNDVEMINLLLDYKAEPNTQNNLGATALTYAAVNESLEAAEVLLENNADPDLQTNNQKSTPLLEAAELGNAELTQLLIKYKADLELKESNGYTALNMAVYFDKLEVAEILLKAGADPETMDKHGITPLIRAAHSESVEMVKLLLKHGADTNSQSEPGKFNALIEASLNDNTEILMLLLEAGADPNTQGANGYTSLHNAVNENHPNIVSILLEAGADPSIKTENGQTPLMIAEERGLEEVAELLREAGAKTRMKN